MLLKGKRVLDINGEETGENCVKTNKESKILHFQVQKDFTNQKNTSRELKVIDTPNILLYNRNEIETNSMLLIDYIIKNTFCDPSRQLILLITPKLKKSYYSYVIIFNQLAEIFDNVFTLECSKGIDPDTFLLYTAANFARCPNVNVSVISNDRYRQRDYRYFMQSIAVERFDFSYQINNCSLLQKKRAEIST